MLRKSSSYSLLTAGLFLGAGLGAFFDGIFFHQILQLHNMLSNKIFPDTLVNLEINMFWDGLFHAFAWIMTLIGIFLLWVASKNDDIPKTDNIFYGALFIGFGLFNLIEGLIDHQILGLHHVAQKASHFYQALSDLLFIASGIILVMIGLWLIRRKKIDM